MADNIQTLDERHGGMKIIKKMNQGALVYLPTHLLEEIRHRNLYIRLMQSLEECLTVLQYAGNAPEAWKATINTQNFLPANLFLQHLCALVDLEGKTLQRIAANYQTWFPHGVIDFDFRGLPYTYTLQEQPPNWSKRHLNISGERIETPAPLTPAMEDAIMVLLFGGVRDRQEKPDLLQRCNIGLYIGDKQKLQDLIYARYLEITPILQR